jgi:hypothetical protein
MQLTTNCSLARFGGGMAGPEVRMCLNAYRNLPCENFGTVILILAIVCFAIKLTCHSNITDS